MAEGRLFGTDGVRGKANVELTVDLATSLARAAGERTDGPVVIGRDTRRSGAMLAAALHAGFNAVGVDTVDLGIIPVGGVSRLGRDVKASYGVMVSASHNPAEDNGIKFFGPDGAKLTDAQEMVIEERLSAGSPWSSPAGAAVGIQSSMTDAVDRYRAKLIDLFSYRLQGIEVVVDCAHGAAFRVAPELLRAVGASVEVVAAEPDGMNINRGCGATHPEFVASHASGRIGLAFDGDADRLIAVDEDGETVDGDVLMAIFASHLREAGKLKGDTVVATVMSNLGFKRAMQAKQIKVVETDVGDRYVLEAMRQTRAVLGGEQSGHIVLEDRSTGDGLRTALRLLEIVAATGKSLRELRKVMTQYPQVLVNVTVRDRTQLPGADAVWDRVRRVEERLGDEGRVLVRASGTEPLVRVMVEAADSARAREAADEIAGVVRTELG